MTRSTSSPMICAHDATLSRWTEISCREVSESRLGSAVKFEGYCGLWAEVQVLGPIQAVDVTFIVKVDRQLLDHS